MWSQLILGAGFAFAAAMQPGPTQSYLLSATMSRGWRRTIPAALAPLLSDAPIFVIAVFVLSRMPSAFMRLLHLGGAVLTAIAGVALYFGASLAGAAKFRRDNPYSSKSRRPDPGEVPRGYSVAALIGAAVAVFGVIGIGRSNSCTRQDSSHGQPSARLPQPVIILV